MLPLALPINLTITDNVVFIFLTIASNGDYTLMFSDIR